MNREQRQPDLALQDALTYACEAGRYQGGWPLIHPRLLCIKNEPPKESAAGQSPDDDHAVLYLNGDGLDGLKRDAVTFALKETNGRIRASARLLKCAPETISNIIRKHHIRFRQMIYALLLFLLLAGCAAPRLRTVSRPVAIMPPVPQMIQGEGRAGLPASPNITLHWDNPNPPEVAKYCLTEFHSTTNLLAPFAFKVYVPAGTNSWAFLKTQSQEFFICRFAQTNVTPWLRTEWNQ